MVRTCALGVMLPILAPGCGWIYDADDFSLGAPDAAHTDAGRDAASVDAGSIDAPPLDAGAPDSSSADAALADGPSCELIPLRVVADISLPGPGECDGSNHTGAFDFLALGSGSPVGMDTLGLFRFALTPAVVGALRAGRVRAAALELSRDTDCLGPETPCPAAAGVLAAFGARSDWDEGPTGAGYAGADWCRRGGGEMAPVGWDAPGASGTMDRGPEAGRVSVTATQVSVSLPVDPAQLAPWATATDLTVLVASADDAVVFAVATHENPVEAEPRLAVTVCPE